MVIPVAEKVQIQGNESRKANFHESFEKKLLTRFPLNGHLFEVKTPPSGIFSHLPTSYVDLTSREIFWIDVGWFDLTITQPLPRSDVGITFES